MGKQNFDMEQALALIAATARQDEPLPSESFGRDPYKVWVSCIISLRTRDAVTAVAGPRVIARYGGIDALAEADSQELARLIYPAGFYNQKAGQLIAAAKVVQERFGGVIPHDIDDLVTLPGTGRKTANLVRTVGFGLPGICVDTHVHRLCNRFGYVRTRTPDDTEAALRKKLPAHLWMDINRLLVLWGQQVCLPRNPRCATCAVAATCPRVGVGK